MALENYRDLSTASSDINAGFQFEFCCTGCSNKWRSPFQPYRTGQIAGFFNRFGFLFTGGRDAGRASGNFADMGSRNAREQALAEAQSQAERFFTPCTNCRQPVCEECLTRDGVCKTCAAEAVSRSQRGRGGAAEAAGGAASACPNCSTPGNGGRFCAECGFDMASTHKSCPSCGVMLSRQSRFCTDCGHAF